MKRSSSSAPRAHVRRRSFVCVCGSRSFSPQGCSVASPRASAWAAGVPCVCACVRACVKGCPPPHAAGQLFFGSPNCGESISRSRSLSFATARLGKTEARNVLAVFHTHAPAGALHTNTRAHGLCTGQPCPTSSCRKPRERAQRAGRGPNVGRTCAAAGAGRRVRRRPLHLRGGVRPAPARRVQAPAVSPARHAPPHVSHLETERERVGRVSARERGREAASHRRPPSLNLLSPLSSFHTQ